MLQYLVSNTIGVQDIVPTPEVINAIQEQAPATNKQLKKRGRGRPLGTTDTYPRILNKLIGKRLNDQLTKKTYWELINKDTISDSNARFKLLDTAVRFSKETNNNIQVNIGISEELAQIKPVRIESCDDVDELITPKDMPSKAVDKAVEPLADKAESAAEAPSDTVSDAASDAANDTAGKPAVDKTQSNDQASSGASKKN